MQEQDSKLGDTEFTDEAEKPHVDMPMTVGSSSRDLDLSGAENLSVAGKMGMMHPYMLLGVMAFMQSAPMIALTALFAWVALIGGFMGGSKAVSRRTPREGRLVAPSGAMSKGFAAIGWACLLALMAGGLGDTMMSFMVLNGAWAGLTLVAVKSGTKTDAQSGWIAGATSQTAAALFFGVPLAFVPGIPLVVKLTPILSAISLYYSWKFMSRRGTDRSRAALNAAATAALATLAFLPATAALIGFSGFEAACHFTVALGSLLLPIWSMRNKLRPALSASGSDATPLPATDRPALPSE